MCDKCDKIHRNSGARPPIAGGQFGIEFFNRPYTQDGITHPNPQFRVLSEDDEYWHVTDLDASVDWIPDLIAVLEKAHKDCVRVKKNG